MRLLPLLVLPLLAACTAPAPDLGPDQIREVTVGGSRFRVYSTGQKAESYRLNPAGPSGTEAVLAQARQAMEQATGCHVVPGSLTGDQSLQRAQLDCLVTRAD